MECNGRVFISHSHEDNERCQPLLDALTQWGIDYWFDKEHIPAGQSFPKHIETALIDRDIFIRVCTRAIQTRPGWGDNEFDLFLILQVDDINAGHKDKRRYISIILDSDYIPRGLERKFVHIEAYRLSQFVWLNELRRALGLSVISDVGTVEPEPDKRRLPVYILLDTSADMAGAPIEALREGVRGLYDKLYADPTARSCVSFSVITFGGEALATIPAPLQDFAPPPLHASGKPMLGQALHLLNQSLDLDLKARTHSDQGDYRPIVFILLSDEPGDAWRSVASRLRSRRSLRPMLIGLFSGTNPEAWRALNDICPEAFRFAEITGDGLRAFIRFVDD